MNTKSTKATETQNNSRSQQLRNADEALWRQVKAAAIMEGITMTKWVENVVREKLNKKQ